jgi:dTDP-4-dehydrorhamnose reductase
VKSKVQRKILLIWKNGQLGYDLQQTLPSCGELIAVGREELNLAVRDDLRSIVRETRPNLIVNAAAYTAVDQAETDGEAARQINAIAPGILAEESKQVGATLIHFSSDYVFDGTKTSPYDESDYTNPLNIYGCTKLAGEVAIEQSAAAYLIFRTGWLYSMRGRNFLTTILRLAREHKDIRVVNDQCGAPTWSRSVAEGTAKVVAGLFEFGGGSAADEPSIVTGTYHLSAGGSATWFDFATAIIEYAEMNSDSERDLGVLHDKPTGKTIARRIVPIPTAEYPTPARRPAYSVLSNARISREFGVCLPAWRTQLRDALQS